MTTAPTKITDPGPGEYAQAALHAAANSAANAYKTALTTLERKCTESAKLAAEIATLEQQIAQYARKHEECSAGLAIMMEIMQNLALGQNDMQTLLDSPEPPAPTNTPIQYRVQIEPKPVPVEPEYSL